MTSNDDRNFNQYGGIGRVSYEVSPAVKPFVEIEGDSRLLDRRRHVRLHALGVGELLHDPHP